MNEDISGLYRDVMKTIGDRIRAARIAAKMTQAEVMIACGWAADGNNARISNYERGQRTPRLEDIEAIAKITNVSVSWLRGYEGDPAVKLEVDELSSAVIARTKSAMIQLFSEQALSMFGSSGETGKVPLVPWEHAPHQLESRDDIKIPWKIWCYCPSLHGPRTYALVLPDDSMQTLVGAHLIHGGSGTKIFVDPDRPAVVGASVLVFDSSSSSILYRSLVGRQGNFCLEARNPAYPTIRLTQSIKILGVVIGSYHDETPYLDQLTIAAT